MTTHPTTATPTMYVPESVSQALESLADGTRTVLAGGTWIMRGGIRGDGFNAHYVLVSKLPELIRLELSDQELVIGSAVTHEQLAKFLRLHEKFSGLRTAAEKSANPAIRRMATIGGNLNTIDFAAADLLPALLALSAEVKLESADGIQTMPVEEFLVKRETLEPRWLLTEVRVPIREGKSAHERLTMRAAGDYPAAIVHVYANVDEVGVASDVTVAIGSVEKTPRILPDLSAKLIGLPLDPVSAEQHARVAAADLVPRDGVEAKGWYRVEVLPGLVANAIRSLSSKNRDENRG